MNKEFNIYMAFIGISISFGGLVGWTLSIGIDYLLILHIMSINLMIIGFTTGIIFIWLSRTKSQTKIPKGVDKK